MSNPTDMNPKPRAAKPHDPTAASNAFTWKVTAAVLFLVALAFVGYRLALKDDALATLVEITGAPLRDTARSVGQWQPAAPQDTLYEGDGARTERSSEARFALSGGARLALAPSSLVRFHRRAPDAPVRVDVEMGEVDVYSDSGTVTLESEFGPLVLEGRSSVKLARHGGQLNVQVDVGSIQLNQRAVVAGERVVLELGGIVLELPEPAASSVPTVEPATEVASSQTATPVDIGDGVTVADLVVEPSSVIIVHDPAPPSAVGVSVSGVCQGPARLESGKRSTEGEGRLSLRFDAGQHDYVVKCLSAPNTVVGRGKVTVVKDTGTRRLPTFAPTANIVTDGRVYTVLFQNKLPNVSVSWPTAPAAAKYTLTVDGRSFTTTTPNRTLNSLSRGKHQVFFTSDTTPVRQSRTTTVEVIFDSQAPTAEVEDPPVDFAAADSVVVRGNTLPGWSVSVDGKELSVDSARTFETRAGGNQTIPIVFTHPVHGTHYYLRRPKASL